MANFDEQLSRMDFLMGYRMPVNENTKSVNVEYSRKGADGKMYGIIKEGAKYYIKTTEEGKENIFESYAYINGFNNRKENEYNSYNEATKQLELKLMSLNEARGIHEDVSTVDFTRGEKVLANLTEAARIELNRVNQIFENSLGIKNNIGDHGNPEGKGTATGADKTGNNGPFSTSVAEPKMDKDFKASQTDPKTANDGYTKANVSDTELQSDKMKKGTDTVAKDMTAAHDDLEGEGVADKNPKGAKAVKMNESLFDYEDVIETPMDQADLDEPYEDGEDISMSDFEEPAVEDVPSDEPIDEPEIGAEGEMADMPAEPEVGNDIVGAEDEEDDELGSLMEEFESLIAGDNETMEGPDGSLDVQTCDKMDESCDCGGDGCEEAMKGPHNNGGETLTWDKMNESQKKAINLVVEGVVSKLKENKKPAKKTLTNEEKLANMISKLVKEEVTKLDAWGKHPKYGKEPMTTPDNKEVLAGTADRDFNDDSTKGKERYGKKIGSSAPFDQVVNVLTDSVMKMLEESLGLKKK